MKILFVLLLLTTPALAQEPYVPPDQELWREMSQAFSRLNMPLEAHQQVQQILLNVQMEATKRAAAKKPPEKK